MKTILSFQDESHRVQLIECDPVGLLDKHVIYDNRKVVQTFIADKTGARKCFLHYLCDIVWQTKIQFPN